jgi:hypothetical protein
MQGMKTISLKLTERLLGKLEQQARERGQGKSAVVRAALEQYLSGAQATPRPLSALDLAGDLVGCAEGPGDLSTNPKYMEGFGE